MSFHWNPSIIHWKFLLIASIYASINFLLNFFYSIDCHELIPFLKKHFMLLVSFTPYEDPQIPLFPPFHVWNPIECFWFPPTLFEYYYAAPMQLMLYQWNGISSLQLQFTPYSYVLLVYLQLSMISLNLFVFSGFFAVTIDFML